MCPVLTSGPSHISSSRSKEGRVVCDDPNIGHSINEAPSASYVIDPYVGETNVRIVRQQVLAMRCALLSTIALFRNVPWRAPSLCAPSCRGQPGDEEVGHRAHLCGSC